MSNKTVFINADFDCLLNKVIQKAKESKPKKSTTKKHYDDFLEFLIAVENLDLPTYLLKNN